MNWLDYTVLISYFVVITLFGLYLSVKIKTSSSFFLGDRKFGWLIMIGQAFSAGTHAEMPVAQAGHLSPLDFQPSGTSGRTCS